MSSPRNAHARPRRIHHTRAACTLLTLAACAASAWSQASQRAAADEDYRREVRACESGQTSQDRATCLNEARHARAERRRGGLYTPQASLQANALARCQVFQPGPDMEACRARVMGQGSVSGSVEGGGLLREYAISVPVEPASSGMGAAGSSPTTAPSSSPSTLPASPDPQTQQQMETPPATSTPPMGAPGSTPRADTPTPVPPHPPMDPRVQHPMNPQMHDQMHAPGTREGMPMQPSMQMPMQPDMRSRDNDQGTETEHDRDMR